MKNIKFSSFKRRDGLYMLDIKYPMYEIVTCLLYKENTCTVIIEFFEKEFFTERKIKIISGISKNNDKPFRIAKKIIKSKILNSILL